MWKLQTHVVKEGLDARLASWLTTKCRLQWLQPQMLWWRRALLMCHDEWRRQSSQWRQTASWNMSCHHYYTMTMNLRSITTYVKSCVTVQHPTNDVGSWPMESNTEALRPRLIVCPGATLSELPQAHVLAPLMGGSWDSHERRREEFDLRDLWCWTAAFTAMLSSTSDDVVLEQTWWRSRDFSN